MELRLAWARKNQAPAQTGYHDSDPKMSGNEVHRQRYQRLTEIEAGIIGQDTHLAYAPRLGFFQNQDGFVLSRVDVRSAALREGKILLVDEQDGG